MGKRCRARVPSVSTFLKLGRISNLPTVWSNVMMATVVVSDNIEPGTLMLMALLCFAGSFAYVGGMFLNDAFDAEYDRQHQSFRPIPSGEISQKSVFAIGFLLLFISFACFSLVHIEYYQYVKKGTEGFTINYGPHFLYAAAALYGSIILYNWVHKKVAFSVLFMAMARASLILSVASSVFTLMHKSALTAAAVHFFYVCSLTIVARLESRVPAFKGKIPYLIAGISAVDALLVLTFKQDVVFAGVFAAFVLLTLYLQRWVRGT